MFVLQVLTEIGVTLLICYGVWHEEELIEFETVFWQWAKRGFKKGNGSK